MSLSLGLIALLAMAMNIKISQLLLEHCFGLLMVQGPMNGPKHL